ncbi:carbohydrate ABC transporter permease [Mesorhizobium sp.]|uniref:carbohydrate ABC transporter permease n=1 Tax=Mesorhizobium sp. TaxID=1871066 RepID=UPI0025C452AF|nr:carbohydrate ABC transporter permease [Mesorhizobium sp.]
MNNARSPLQTIAIYLGALLILVWSGGPFIWQFSTSFQLDKALTSGSPSLIPAPFTLEHYYNAFIEKQLHRYVWNSLVVSLATTFLCLFVGSLAAFALSRLNVKGRFGILMVILSVSMFPQIALVGPLYLVATNLGLLDTYTALIITDLALGLPLVTWVLFGYFETLPREIDEAARMDGVSVPGLHWHIILPMSLPSLVTTGLLAFITAWNEPVRPRLHLQHRSPDDPCRHRQFHQPILRALGRHRRSFGSRHRPFDRAGAVLPAPHHRRADAGRHQGMKG